MVFLKTFLDGKYCEDSSEYLLHSTESQSFTFGRQNVCFWLNYASNIRLVVAVQIFLWGQGNTQIKPVQGAASPTLSFVRSHTCIVPRLRGAAGLTKNKKRQRFHSPGTRPKSSVIPSLVCMLYVSKTAEDWGKKPRVWTLYWATKWNKMADRQLQ